MDYIGSPGDLVVKKPPDNAGDVRCKFNPWVRKIPWRRDRLPTLIFMHFPGGSDGKESACNAGDPG